MKTLRGSVIAAFFIVIIIAAISWSFFVLKNPEKFPFRTISVVMTENHHVDPALIKKIVRENVRGGFFSLQVNQLRQALLEIPWVYEVSFRRIWPDRLVIDMEEQKAVARWGNDALLNAQGDIFKPPIHSIPQQLPLLTGPPDSQQEVWQCWQQLNQIVQPLGVHITAMSLNARHAWQLTINDRLQVMLGRESINQRMAHLVDIYPKVISDRQDEVERIDLRYPNGVAIQWKSKATDNINPAIR